MTYNSFNDDPKERFLRKDKALQDGKSYPVNKDTICTLPKAGGNDLLRPSVQIEKAQKEK